MMKKVSHYELKGLMMTQGFPSAPATAAGADEKHGLRL